MANFSFKTTGLPESVKGVIEGHNFTQGKPHTKIYEGMKGLTFKNCNLQNCDVPADSKVESCLRCQTNFCSHLHERWMEKEFISKCPTDCAHLVITDTIMIDGVAVDTNRTYEDKGAE